MLPFPPAPDGYSYVRQQLGGGHYTSTGYFADGVVDANGRGRTVANVAGVGTLMFDIDIVSVVSEARRAAGQVVEDKVGERKAYMYTLPNDVVDGYRKWIADKLLPTMEAAVGMAPTTIVNTGWGYHLHYRVAADVCRDTAALQNAAKMCITEANRLCIELGRTLTARDGSSKRLEHLAPWDNTHDVGARLCRIPNTWNVKCPERPRMCEVVEGGDPHSIVDRAAVARIQSRLGDPDLFIPVSPRRGPKRRKAIDIDFRTQQLPDGRTWQQVVDMLEVGEKLKVICPFGGTTKGSGWFAKDIRDGEVKTRYCSSPENTTWWNSAVSVDRSSMRADLARDGKGNPLNNSLNLKALLEQDGSYDLWFDEFAQCIKNGDVPVDDLAVTELQVVMERDYNWTWCPSEKRRFDMMSYVANQNKRNPLAEYLRSIKWDGQPRGDRLFIDACGVKDTRLHRTYGLRFLVAMVARALAPGCKMDTCLVLAGPQSWGKSTFYKLLADVPGLTGMYSDTRIDVGSKDSFLQLYGTWLYEDAELCGHTSAGRDSRKNFLSSATDTFRPPYGRHLKTYKRHTVVVGSTNNDRFLDDPTGSRRYWVIAVGGSSRKNDHLDREWLSQSRDQLFAEAVHHFDAGVQWWLTQDEEKLRALQNSDHQYRDWFAECAEDVYNANAGGLDSGFRMSAFASAIPFTSGVCTQKHGRKLKEALLSAGFQYIHTHKHQRTYYRPTVQMPDEVSTGLAILDDKRRPERGVVKLAR